MKGLGYPFGKWLFGLPILVISIITIVIMLIYNYCNEFLKTRELEDSDVHIYAGSYVELRGYITSDYVVKSTSQQTDVQCIKLSFDANSIDCDMMVRAYLKKYPKINIGEIVVIKGKLLVPEDIQGGFSYSDYLKKKGIEYVMYYPEVEYSGKYGIGLLLRYLYKMREKVVSKMNYYLPEPHSSLLSGILLGVKNTMPEGFSEDLRKTGTTHIIAASGYNVAVIANFLMLFMKFFSRRLRIVVGIVFVWIFVVISGGSIPVVRAAIMVSISLFALLLGRYSNVSQSLVLSAAIMFFGNKYLFEDISFQLSFLSTAGLIYLVPIVKKYLSFIPKSLEESITVTLSAILSTFPVTVFNFHSFSIISLLANFLVLPTVEVVMLLGAIFIVIPTFLSPLLKLISIILWVPLDYFIRVVGYLSSLSFSSVEVPNFGIVAMFLCYLVMIILIALNPKIRHYE